MLKYNRKMNVFVTSVLIISVIFLAGNLCRSASVFSNQKIPISGEVSYDSENHQYTVYCMIGGTSVPHVIDEDEAEVVSTKPGEEPYVETNQSPFRKGKEIIHADNAFN